MGDATYYNDPDETSDLYDECNTGKICFNSSYNYQKMIECHEGLIHVNHEKLNF